MPAAGRLLLIPSKLDPDEQEIQLTPLLPQVGEAIQQAVLPAIAQFLSSGFQCRSLLHGLFVRLVGLISQQFFKFLSQ